MIRETSQEVYNQIKKEGLLGGMQWKVYKFLFQHGPLTQGEVSRYLYVDRNVSSPRFAELVRMGLVEMKGKRLCETTNRPTLIWDVTKNLPFKQIKRISLPKVVAELREQLSQRDVTIRQMFLEIGELRAKGQMRLI